MNTPAPLRVAFVCTGNICRSAMAEMLMRAELARTGRTDLAVESFGTSDEELGNPIDPRARRELEAHGIPVHPHSPRQLTRADVERADLVVVMTARHRSRVERLAAGCAHVPPIRLLHQFDAGADWRAEPDAGVPDVADPWYGSAEDFAETYRELVHALPGIMAAADELLCQRHGG